MCGRKIKWYVWIYTLYKYLVPVAAAGLTFLSLNKKVSKEVSLGEALTAKPFFSAAMVFPAVARL